VGDFLSRPRVMTFSSGKDGAEDPSTTSAPLGEHQAQEMLNRGYGMVRRDTMDGPRI